MATLEINGHSVQVDDSFKTLSREEQERTVNEIAASLPKSENFMSQVNRGIADAVGGAVDFLNPFDKPHALNPFTEGTGSATPVISGAMEAVGAKPATGEATTPGQQFARGLGGGAASLIPVTKASQALSKAGGVVGPMASTIAQSLRTPMGAGTEVLASGMSRSAQEMAAQEGLPEWAQQTAGIVAPMSVPAAASATKTAVGALPITALAKQGARSLAGAIAPYTKAGASQVARTRVQELAGGPQRAEELAGRITGQTETGLSPARQTGDPNLIGLEELAAAQDPNLRERLAAGVEAGQQAGRAAISEMGGDVEVARKFVTQRQAEFKESLQARADEAMQKAEANVQRLGPQATEADNSREVMRQIDSSYNAVSAEERELWDAVPMDAVSTVSASRARAQKWEKELGPIGSGNIPRAAKTWLLDQNNVLTDQGSVRDMHQLYSTLRQTARDARSGTTPNKTLAMIADDIAEGILEDLGRFDGSTPAGQAIGEALAFTAAKHEVFSRGAVGRLRKQTPQGDTAVDPELAMERTIGRGGEAANVAARQMATATEGRSEYAVQDYIKDRFTKAAISPTGEMTSSKARKFLQDNLSLIRRYPELRDEVLIAVKSQEDASSLNKRIEGIIRASQTKKDSALAAFVDGPPEKAVNAVFTAKRPLEAVKILRNAVAKDETGDALSGLKGAFVDNLMASAKPEGLKAALADPRMNAILREVFDTKEMGRLGRIADELAQATERGANVGESLSGAAPNKLIEYIVRIGAARHGAELGGAGGGASLQTAQMASSRAKEIMGRLVNDKASDIIADAMEDPDLLRALLTDVNRVDLEKELMPLFLPYMVGGVTGTYGAQ